MHLSIIFFSICSISSLVLPLIISWYWLLILTIFFFIILFQWFLIVLSVLPGIFSLKVDQLFPYFLCSKKRAHSSSFDQPVFLTSGFRWLYHLSRHCLPKRPGRYVDILDHFSGPNFLTNSINFKSSSLVQGPLTLFGSNIFCHRVWHCLAFLFSNFSEILTQFIFNILFISFSGLLFFSSSFSAKFFSLFKFILFFSLFSLFIKSLIWLFISVFSFPFSFGAFSFWIFLFSKYFLTCSTRMASSEEDHDI